jgi:hypothetical protein
MGRRVMDLSPIAFEPNRRALRCSARRRVDDSWTMVQWFGMGPFKKMMGLEAHRASNRLSAMHTKQMLAAAALSLMASAPLVAIAADADPGIFVTPTDAWSIEITPYAWLPGIKGDITVRNTTVGVDQSFSDIFKSVKFAADALGIARYNNWLIYTQIDYFSLSTTQLENAPARGSLATKDTLYLVGAGYRINGWSSGQTFDFLLGAQGLHIDNTLSLYRIGEFSSSNNVVDAVVMVRPSLQLSQHWLFNPTMSIGGGDSKLTYQLQPQFQYQFNATWEMRFGYRRLSYNIDSSRGNNLDVRMSGPLIGFGATF